MIMVRNIAVPLRVQSWKHITECPVLFLNLYLLEVKNIEPYLSNKILVPFRVFFKNFRRAPHHFYLGLPLPPPPLPLHHRAECALVACSLYPKGGLFAQITITTCTQTTLMTVASSQGTIVCRSISSQLTPSSSLAILQTSRNTWIWVPHPTTVTSEPEITWQGNVRKS